MALTDVVAAETVDESGQVEVAGNDGYLIGRLISEIERFLIGAAEEEEPGASLLVVDGADVQRRVARRVLGVHLAPVEKEILQVLDQAVPAGL